MIRSYSSMLRTDHNNPQYASHCSKHEAGACRASSKVFAHADCAHFSPRLSTPTWESGRLRAKKIDDLHIGPLPCLEDLAIFRCNNGIDLRAENLRTIDAQCDLARRQVMYTHVYSHS